MRIVNRKEFLQLPSGTLFCQCEQKWVFEDLHVKFGSLIHDDRNDDFVSMSFTSVEANDSDEWLNRLEDMADNGTSYPLDLDAAGRDGQFMRDAWFMVFERSDVVKLRDFLTSVLEGDA